MMALVLRAFVIEAFKIPSESMLPTLLVGDHLFVNKFVYGIRIPFTQNYIVTFDEPQKGEVVVFTFPRMDAKAHLAMQPANMRACIDQRSLREDKDMIKRIIGVAGDTVEVKSAKVFVNGAPLEREFLRKAPTGNYLHPYESVEHEMNDGKTYTIRLLNSGRRDFGPIKVKPGHVFVMGDNRDQSADSRCWGQVPVEFIKGRAMVIWWSKGRKGIRWERFGDVIK
jgi:signal peptidase I